MSTKQGREFGLLVGAAFIAIAAILWWRGRSAAVAPLGGVGAVLVIAGLLVPTLLGPVYRAWMGFALLLSKFTTPIFMGVVYFLVITPMSLGMRLFGKNGLVHREQGGSYWIERQEPRPAARQMERQF